MADVVSSHSATTFGTKLRSFSQAAATFDVFTFKRQASSSRDQSIISILPRQALAWYGQNEVARRVAILKHCRTSTMIGCLEPSIAMDRRLERQVAASNLAVAA
jgi:hypothetical protein